MREIVLSLVNRVVISGESKKPDSASGKRKNSDSDLNPNKKKKE